MHDPDDTQLAEDGAEPIAARAEQAIDAQAREERLEQLDDRAVALAEREEALTAADEAQRLEDAAERTKAQRKAD